MTILLIVFVYPLIVRRSAAGDHRSGHFLSPGIYVNAYDSIGSPHYTLNLDDAAAKRIASKLDDEDRVAIKEWLVAAGVPRRATSPPRTRQHCLICG